MALNAVSTFLKTIVGGPVYALFPRQYEAAAGALSLVEPGTSDITVGDWGEFQVPLVEPLVTRITGFDITDADDYRKAGDGIKAGLSAVAIIGAAVAALALSKVVR